MLFYSSSEDIEEDNYNHERRKVTPISVNSHLYCHSSNLELTSDAFDSSTDPKTQKYVKRSNLIYKIF